MLEDTAKRLAVLIDHQTHVSLAENTCPDRPIKPVLVLPDCPPVQHLRAWMERGNKGTRSPLKYCITHDVPLVFLRTS
jgi:hypothetical protein